MWPATSSPWKATCHSSGTGLRRLEERRVLVLGPLVGALAPVVGEGLGPGLPDPPDEGGVGRVDRPCLEPVGQRDVGDVVEVGPDHLGEAPGDLEAGGLDERAPTDVLAVDEAARRRPVGRSGMPAWMLGDPPALPGEHGRSDARDRGPSGRDDTGCRTSACRRCGRPSSGGRSRPSGRRARRRRSRGSRSQFDRMGVADVDRLGRRDLDRRRSRPGSPC